MSATKAKSFAIKLFLFSLPFLALVVIYICFDPFKMLWSYDSYYESGRPNYITLNKDHVSTRNWINHYSQYRYDAYIFGSSRSMFYEIGDWKDHIGEERNKCYHFDASLESLYGVACKFNFLSARKVKIRNALIVLDESLLGKTDNSAGHLFMKDPLLSGENALGLQAECLKEFFDYSFLHALLDFKLSGRIKNYMRKNALLDDYTFSYDPVLNEVKMDSFENMIRNDRLYYYDSRQALFYDRDSSNPKIAAPRIGRAQSALLMGIRKVLLENQADFRIVISPLYDMRQLNPADLKALRDIFGEKKVFDFSGINAFTRDKYNYYEVNHYRPHVAREIMRIIYSPDPAAASPDPAMASFRP